MKALMDMSETRKSRSPAPRAGMRGWAATAALFAVLAHTALFAPGCAEKKPPANVVLITMDTLRADHVGCYGYERDTTPNIDKFARDSVIFKNAFAPMPTTLPSHSSMMTSLYPFEHGMRANGWKLDSDVTTLAEILKEKGYDTAAFISVTGTIGKKHGIAQGFDIFDEETRFGGGGRHNERLAEDTTSLVLDWLKSRRDNTNPFFLWAHYWDPHSDYDAPDQFRSMFETPGVTEEIDGTSESLIDILGKRLIPLPADVEYLISLYDGEIRYMDAHIGRLLDFLESNRDTMIILVADHGENFGQHDSWMHAVRIYEENIRVPLIIRTPGASGATGVRECQAEHVDLMPTILDYLSIRTSTKFSGHSLRPAIERNATLIGQGFIDRQYVSEEYSERFNVERETLLGFRRWPWKFLLHSGGTCELYNLSTDPDELNNIASQEADLVESFKAEALEYLQKIREAKVPEIDDDTREQLKALGYL